MQQILYKENPEIVTYYDDTLEAYRSDRWTGFQISPDPNGYLLNQYTTYSAITIGHPVTAGQANAAGGGDLDRRVGRCPAGHRRASS